MKLTALDIPKNPDERRAWVCYQLRIKGLSLKALAQREGVTQQSMSSALLVPSSHLEEVIAGALDLTARELFPERFAGGGRRRSNTRSPNRTSPQPLRNVKDGEAA